MNGLCDRCGDIVIIAEKYISYRNHYIPFECVYDIKVKGKKLLINHYKLNSTLPTMSIYFVDKESAVRCYNRLIEQN